MPDTIYYYCRFCAERLAARLVMDFDSYPKLREDVQKKLSVFQSNFIDLDLQILPQSICKSCYETLNRAFLFANNVRKSQIVLIELYLDIVGSDDDDNAESLSKMRPSVEDPFCVNGEDTSIHEKQNTSVSVNKGAFSTDENMSIGAEAIKESSDNKGISLGRHKTGKEPNVDRELDNFDITAAENDTLSQNHESITIIECKVETSGNEEDTDRTVNTDSIKDRTVMNETELSLNQESHECKEETTGNDQETDRTVNIDSIDDSRDILKETASSQSQESLDCKEETSDNDYEDTELYPLDITTDDPIMRETLSLQGQDTYESQGEVTSSRHDTVRKEPNVDSELLNLNTTATGKDTITPQNHELITMIEYKEETTDNEEDLDKINTKYSTEDRGATAKETPSTESQESKSSKEVTKANYKDTDRIVSTNSTVDRTSVMKETVATQSEESLECKEQKKKKRKKDNNDYDKKQQKKKRKRENNDNDYEANRRKDQIDSTTDSDVILKETVPLDSRETSEFQEAVTPDKVLIVDKISVSIVTWDTILYDCKLCDSKFSDINSLREHCKSLHQVCNGFRCRECSMELADFDMFVSHHREHRPELEGFCQFCNMELKSAGAGHVASHGDLFCKFCGEIFISANGFKEHYLLYAPEAVNNERSHCVHCGHELGNDETPHRDALSDACVACGEHFREQTLQQNVSFSRVLSTRENDTFFSTDALINIDKENVSNIKIFKNRKNCHVWRYFECDHCHKRFKFKYSLQQHLAIHYDVCPFYCQFCDAKFTLRKDLLRHLKSNKHARVAAGETSNLKLEKRFECDHCHKQFKFKSNLQQHMDIHYDVYPFYCKFCDAKFKRHSRLKLHLNSDKHARAAAGETSSVKLEKHFECDHCHKLFSYKFLLKRHMVIHYDVCPFYCQFCDAKFTLRKDLLRHLKSNKHARVAAGETSNLKLEKRFECDHCHKQFKFKSNLQQHMDIHYDVYPFYCKFCDAKFKRHSHLKLHLNSDKHARAAAGETSSVKLEKHFECDHCHKLFSYKFLLKRHMVIHYDVYPFYCKLCDAKFKQHFHLKLHLNSHKHARAAVAKTSTVKLDKHLECDHCHKRFSFKFLLKRHMAIHYDVYPFYCKFCDAKFKRHFNLKQHLSSDKHARAAGETSNLKLEKHFECDHCHKLFSYKFLLQQHMPIHYDVYPFYCKLCDAKFKQHSQLKLHLKSSKHARAAGETSNLKLEKHFECDHCHKRFSFKFHIQRHMTIHYDVYPFYCKLCDAKFKQRSQLKLHLKTSKHARAAAGETSNLKLEKHFECDHCHKRFSCKFLLQQHMAIHYDVYPFYCKFCDAKFKQHSYFKQHLKSDKHARAAADETGRANIQKYFECDHCHKQFKCKSNLQQHMAIHYDVYPFYCKFCDAKFMESSNWIQHLKSDKHTGTIQKIIQYSNSVQINKSAHAHIQTCYTRLLSSFSNTCDA